MLRTMGPRPSHLCLRTFLPSSPTLRIPSPQLQITVPIRTKITPQLLCTTGASSTVSALLPIRTLHRPKLQPQPRSHDCCIPHPRIRINMMRWILPRMAKRGRRFTSAGVPMFLRSTSLRPPCGKVWTSGISFCETGFYTVTRLLQMCQILISFTG